jgi:hypothetical protein
MKKLPEYFAIKHKKKDPRWKQYIAYLNKRFGVDLDGTSESYPYYGYGGSTQYMDMYHTIPSGFSKHVTVLTLDEFFDIIEPKTLPTHWAIRPTNETEGAAILTWFNANGERTYLPGGEQNYYWHFPAYEPTNHCLMSRIHNDNYTQITFAEFQEHVLKENPNKSQPMKNTTVKKSELEQIHNVACSTWKNKIAELTLRNPFGELVELTQTEVDEMFDAATSSQLPVLNKIFGKRERIDFDKIKMGSKVMIQRTGQHCTGIDAIDLKEPVDVVFYKTPHLIDGYNKFSLNSSHSSYCTFHQNGKFVLFSSDSNVEYITKVVE